MFPSLVGQNPLEFRGNYTAADTSGLITQSRMIGIRSPGRSGDFDGTTYTNGTFPSTEYDSDIVWSDGYFVRAPGGLNSSGGAS